ncbi:hypothetical protein lbkm_0160 [Lachnospiraceae bacterium KM106-2]|nr:hypothetical protein lbkm_0160 [Lachnospiraceae bacterium KM106-2]
MKKLRIVVVLAILAVGYFGLQRSEKQEAKFNVEVDGMTVELDKTTVKDLKDHGFTLADGISSDLPATMEPKTVSLSNTGSAMKSDEQYFGFGVINRTNTNVSIEEAKIESVSIHYKDTYIKGNKVDTYQEAKVMGFNPKGMTMDEVKSQLKKEVDEASISQNKEDQLQVKVDDHYCNYYFDKDGKLETVSTSIAVATTFRK